MSCRRFSFSFVTLMFLVIAWSTQVSAEPLRGILDGATYEGMLREVDASDGGDDDRLVFEGGHFTSRACEDYGFDRAEYSADRSGGQVRFTATATSPTHGKMEWDGVVSGDRIEAHVVWTKERWYWDTRREYRFEGTLAP